MTAASRYLWLLVLLGLFIHCSEKPTETIVVPEEKWPFRPPSTQPLDAFVMSAAIGRGFNLGNALEAAVEGEGGMVIQDHYFKIIADAGFTSIRLPVTWSAHSMTVPPFYIEAAFFERVDHVIQEALKNGLIVILNDHHFDELNADPQAYKGWLIALWEQIARHYKDYPDELYFEILNEPHGEFNTHPEWWNSLAAEALAVIRNLNPYRMTVIGPINWNSINSLPTLELPKEDQSLIATFHFYDPFQFTHQGAEWAGEEAQSWLGTKWSGTLDQRNAVTAQLDKAVKWAEEQGRPLYLGEFGAYSKADDNSRYVWTDFVARSAEKRHISWTYWEFGAGFGAYDREARAWRPLILRALMPGG